MKRTVRIAAVSLLLCIALSVDGICLAYGSGSDTLEDVTLSENALYNGIVIPEDYGFENDNLYGYETATPYLLSEAEGGYKPDVVNIDVGRQLFVDDFLIDSTDLTQTYHQAKTYNQPVFSRDDTGVGNGTAGNSGGVWYDMEEKVYKMWYGVSFGNYVGYATSTDGVNWETPSIGISGTNIVSQQRSDSYSIWIDYDAPAKERYKMMIRSPDIDANGDGKNETEVPAVLYTSATGLTWVKRGETGTLGDRSTFYQNWFTKEWVFSIRMINEYSAWGNELSTRRTRFYHAGDTWMEASQWDWNDDSAPTFWLKTDASDPIDTTQMGNNIPQLYNFDSIAYESIMLGMFEIWYGPHNTTVTNTKTPKITELQATYSRDGFNYSRPVRGAGNALISASRVKGDWDYGYLQSSTGGLIVYDDEIRIYYSAFSGEYEEGGVTHYGGYYGGAVGIASLRRDGFASMDGCGTLTTVPLTVTKPVKYLFVNADAANGSLKAEILDADGNVVVGYSATDCVAMTTDDCCYRLSWNGAENLSFLQSKGFRIRFTMENGELYSFWLSADPQGASGGAVGAGYAGSKDLNPVFEEDPTEPSNDDNGGSTHVEPKKSCGSSLDSGALAILLPAGAVLTMCKDKKKIQKLRQKGD